MSDMSQSGQSFLGKSKELAGLEMVMSSVSSVSSTTSVVAARAPVAIVGRGDSITAPVYLLADLHVAGLLGLLDELRGAHGSRYHANV